jgi:hypothetical protein
MADVPLPQGSQTVPGLSYLLLTSNNCNSQLTPQLKSHSQSYFTTGRLLPISSSWHQAPWGSWPDSFWGVVGGTLNLSSHSPYVTSSLTRRWIFLLWIGFAFVKCMYITHRMLLKIFLMRYIQVLCQSRLRKACLSYLSYTTTAA